MTLSPAIAPIVFLSVSNVFMTFAWYGHLKYKASPLIIAIVASWAIAFFEYCLQVPANRLGHGRFSAYELKIIQELVTLAVFVLFALVWLRESPRWNHIVAFALLVGAACFTFLPSAAQLPSAQR